MRNLQCQTCGHVRTVHVGATGPCLSHGPGLLACDCTKFSCVHFQTSYPDDAVGTRECFDCGERLPAPPDWERPSIEHLIERSSLGTPGALALRAQASPAAVHRVLRRVDALDAQDALGLLRICPECGLVDNVTECPSCVDAEGGCPMQALSLATLGQALLDLDCVAACADKDCAFCEATIVRTRPLINAVLHALGVTFSPVPR